MKEESSKVEYVAFDAKGKILGRLATQIAKVLSGKGKVDYTPHIGSQDWAIIINSDDVRLSGEKAKKKIYWRHTGFPGGIKQRTFEEMMEIDSREVIMNAVKGMVPKNKLGKNSLTRLRVFKDEKHDFENEVTKEIK
ncbi:MAG: 50S ribosomal protein L13 [Patescibacteria group bacterium]|jgi:large subunit ribosomal protein L13|nr:50S ribosomal protein L13 [Patescibacteria group bacterium]